MWKERADAGVQARPQGPGPHLQALAGGRKLSLGQMSLAHKAGPGSSSPSSTYNWDSILLWSMNQQYQYLLGVC